MEEADIFYCREISIDLENKSPLIFYCPPFCLVFVPVYKKKKLKSLMDRLLSFQFLL